MFFSKSFCALHVEEKIKFESHPFLHLMLLIYLDKNLPFAFLKRRIYAHADERDGFQALLPHQQQQAQLNHLA